MSCALDRIADRLQEMAEGSGCRWTELGRRVETATASAFLVIKIETGGESATGRVYESAIQLTEYPCQNEQITAFCDKYRRAFRG